MKHIPTRLKCLKKTEVLHTLSHFMVMCLCVNKPLFQEWAQGMFLQSLSVCQAQVLAPPEDPLMWAPSAL